MEVADRALLRLHVEAVWGVKLPPLEQNETAVLPESAQPNWRLCAADLAEGRLLIWRSDTTAKERTELLARLDAASAAPPDAAPASGVGREVALRLAAAPVIDLAAARQTARPLTRDDFARIEAFWPGEAEATLGPDLRPVIGVIVGGRLLSVAHSSRRTAQACELGIETRPEARRQRYALAATVVWSAAINDEGLTPIYSALAENTASLRLAVAAGYRVFARAALLE
ncbi:MAG TPA: GNAT family N-acetyltransferase [Ktedonobacterales bacterium]